MNNDEIIHKQQRLDRLPKFRYYQEAINLLDEMLNEARADTAKEVFAELDKAAWEQIEPSRLEEFYKQFSNVKDLEAALKIAASFGVIGFNTEEYQALKHKYKVD